jgi:hypothetical protein
VTPTIWKWFARTNEQFEAAAQVLIPAGLVAHFTTAE